MSVIATAVSALIEAGVSGDALVAAIAKMEAAQAAAAMPVRTGDRPRDLGLSAGQWSALRLLVFERDGFQCQYCGLSDLEHPQCDHVIPLSRGGVTNLRNLATSCKSCNSSKRDRLVSEWVRS